ncbi:uncharacterized protein LOC143251647 [Tachypleus tridentatus]|uniref:uncharacterized protein LOC143251647 n=1 Tax=Tachypleus tridentatus TaxID=6853 RepID=UPI003FD1D099
MTVRIEVVCLFIVYFLLQGKAFPTIKPFAFPKNITLGNGYQVMCAVDTGISPFRFEWFKDSVYLDIEDKNKRVITDEKFSVLVIDPVTLSDQGNYTCKVKSERGSTSFSTELYVKGGLLCHLQKTIKNESSERETYKTNLNTSLVKDIDKLKQEVKDLKRDVEESFLMDVNSEPRKVTDLLSSLAVRLEQITEQASQYKQYQRDFQFEVTHYEELEK